MTKKSFDSMFSSIKQFLRENKMQIVFSIIAITIGILLGILLSASDRNFVNILSRTDENIIKYITGSADSTAIFWQRFLSGLFALILIFIFCLNFYSGLFSLVYICYQTALFILISIEGIKYYGFSMLASTILIYLPINIILIFIVSIFYLICISRAAQQNKYKLKFSSTFDAEYFFKIALLIVIFIVFQIISNLLLPLLFRGIYIINY